MPKEGSNSRSLAKKIRDLQRLLALDSLPETTRQEKERALASLQAQKSSHANLIEREKMREKYKMVKFVEHQKAVRKLAKAKKSLSNTGGGDATSQTQQKQKEEEVRKCEIELIYIENYPVLEKYISLYKELEGPGSEKTRTRRAELLKMAESGSLGAAKPSTKSSPSTKIEVEKEEEEDDFFE